MSKQKVKTNRPKRIKKPFSRKIILGLAVLGFILGYIAIFMPADNCVYAYVGVVDNLNKEEWIAREILYFSGWDLIFGDYNKRAFTRGLPELATSWICLIISCVITLIGILMRIGDKRKQANILQLIGGFGVLLSGGNFAFVVPYNGMEYMDPMYTPSGKGRLATPAHAGHGLIVIILFGVVGGILIVVSAFMDIKNQKLIPIWNNVYPDNQFLSNGKTLKEAGGKIVVGSAEAQQKPAMATASNTGVSTSTPTPIIPSQPVIQETKPTATVEEHPKTVSTELPKPEVKEEPKKEKKSLFGNHKKEKVKKEKVKIKKEKPIKEPKPKKPAKEPKPKKPLFGSKKKK